MTSDDDAACYVSRALNQQKLAAKFVDPVAAGQWFIARLATPTPDVHLKLSFSAEAGFGQIDE